MDLPRLRASLADAPVVRLGDYEYFVHPITDGVPPGDPEVLREVADAIAAVGDFACDRIVTVEAAGFPLAAAVALRVGRPYVFIRKRRYGLPGEVGVAQETGYSGSQLYVNGIGPGDRITLVDDVLSTGGTLRAVVRALQDIGAEIVDVIIVFEKTREREALERELGVRIKTLLRVEIRDGKMVEWEP